MLALRLVTARVRYILSVFFLFLRPQAGDGTAIFTWSFEPREGLTPSAEVE